MECLLVDGLGIRLELHEESIDDWLIIVTGSGDFWSCLASLFTGLGFFWSLNDNLLFLIFSGSAGVGHLGDSLGISIFLNSECESDKVSAVQDETDVKGVGRVEGDMVGASFGSGPEWLSMGVEGVLGVKVDQVADIMVEHFEEKILGDLDAALEVTSLGDVEQVGNLLKFLPNCATVAVLVGSSDEFLLVFQERDGILSSVDEEGVKLLTAPLDAMFDLTWEVS